MARRRGRPRAPSARNGPNGSLTFLAPTPRRAKRTIAGTIAASRPTSIATGTVVPSIAPSTSASLTSPMPIPPGAISAAAKRKPPAASAPTAHCGLGWIAVCAARMTTAAGRTMRLGMIPCSMSVAEIATRTRQKNAATSASGWRPNFHTQPATSSADASSTAG